MTKPREVGLDPNLSFASSPSGNHYLAAVLKELRVQPGDAIIDLGCGKGSAMRTMLRFPFSEVDGLELSGEIAATAIANFERLKERRSRIFIRDAREFTEFDRYNFIYLYNPFPAVIMDAVLVSVRESIGRVPREAVIIYANPTCRDSLLRSGFREAYSRPGEWGNPITVFTSETLSASRLSAPR